MDIKITSPIDISFETVGFEDKYGSVEFKITIINGGFDYHQSLTLSAWFTYQSFDDFISNLTLRSTASLSDISDGFTLVLNPDEDYIECSYLDESYIINNHSSFKARRRLTDSYEQIALSFSDYPRSWSINLRQ